MNETTKQYISGLVSVVVPAYNAADFLEDNVTSYLEQTLSNIEIIIVNDGSKDNTQQIAEKLAKKDTRVRVVNKINGGLSSARNAGVEAASGEYLFFIDPDDYMEDDTLETLFSSLELTGSDVAITGYDLEYPKKTNLPGAWMQQLFSQTKQHFTVQEFPNVLQASTAWGKLIRASFYEQAGLTFIDGILYEDQPFTAKMYASAKNGIDLIGAYKVHWVQRDESISHQVTVDDLYARLNAAQLTLEILSENADEHVKTARLVQNLNNDFRYIMRQFNKVSDEYNALIFKALPQFYNLLADKSQLDAIVDVAYQLLAKGDVETFSALLEATNISNYKMKLISQQGQPVVDWSPLKYIGEFSSTGHVLSENFQPRAFISGFDAGEDGVDLDIQAYVTKLDDHEFSYDVRLQLVEIEPTGEQDNVLFELTPSAQFAKPDTIREHKEWWADYSDNFYRFTVPNQVCQQLETRVRLQVVISVGGQEYITDVNRVRNNSTGRWQNVPLSKTNQICLKKDKTSKSGFYYLEYVPVATVELQTSNDAELSFKITSGVPLAAAEMVSIGRHKKKLKLQLNSSDEENVYTVHVSLKKLRRLYHILKDILTKHRPKQKNWQFNLLDTQSNPVLSLIDTQNPIVDHNVAMTNLPTGNAKLMVAPVVEVKHAQVTDNTLHMDVRALNVPAEGLDVCVDVVAKKAKIKQRIHLNGEQVNHVEVALTHSVFGQEVPLPITQYTISFKNLRNREFNTFYDEAFVKSLPFDGYHDAIHNHRIDFNYSKRKLRVQFFNEMPDEDKGGYGWSRLLSEYLNSSKPVDPKKVLFRTYYGESVTDNAVALTEEILKRPDKDLTIYWAVQNQHIAVPAGTHRVIINSAEWFDILATAGTVVENVHQINYMHKKPGQRIVQAFHGYPYKQMGRAFYEDKEYTLARIKSFQDREAQWDFILSPAPYATPLYQDSFNFYGKMLEVGHPRNDILVDANRATERADINKQVRQRLHIGMDKKIVLYAPTYRDYASDTEFASHRVDFVDYNKLAKQLGDEYVLLIRGHMMNRRAGDTVDANNVIDVTAYPEILDLIIASDMAVLDYSSLRFDYAQTGKPMIFLVPDLALYEETRGGLMPYLPTAPGWIVNSQQELADAINHADDYMTLFGDAWTTFRATYTPMDDGKASQRMVDLLFKQEDATK
ncbi:CDP-glycerol glycerophosphotransferase family protein [Weissella ceti]|uniref:CDP-glycerol glycerophosphotransferase family protein n=1 Tax=Weissella ceti TaxID=759620 RepID=A0ABT3E405_9LACO|nr:CDP-glycerol glycerophosphotransferase family protein [Weissella ceti]MCW0953127.1 CDP-glycerol glycerophosphotransferase family protein [Weissella ceti]QVK12646.1 CDP-glycerol glycerophosphotransferase family protein [Weissella ceti]